MLQRSKQVLFALLSILMLSQSVAAVTDGCVDPGKSPTSAELVDNSYTDHGCQSGCCEAPKYDTPSCCDVTGCDGDCHPYCLCHDIYTTLAVNPPALNVAMPVFLSCECRFVHYHYANPEPQTLLRPPCF